MPILTFLAVPPPRYSNKKNYFMNDIVFHALNNVFAITVNLVQYYTDRLFLFKAEWPTEFRFRSGEFVIVWVRKKQQVGLSMIL